MKVPSRLVAHRCYFIFHAAVIACFAVAVALVGCGTRSSLTTLKTGGAGGALLPPSGGANTGGVAQTEGIRTGGVTPTGGTPTQSCPDAISVSPCGGDVVGDWTVVPGCLGTSGARDIRSLGLGCTDMDVTGVLRVSGFFKIFESGGFVDKTLTTGEETLELSPRCLEVSGTIVTCQSLAKVVRASMGYETLSCSAASAGGCVCVGTINQNGSLGRLSADPIFSGPLTFINDRISTGIDTMTGEVIGYTFCRSGKELRLTPRPSTPWTTGTIVLVDGSSVATGGIVAAGAVGAVLPPAEAANPAPPGAATTSAAASP